MSTRAVPAKDKQSGPPEAKPPKALSDEQLAKYLPQEVEVDIEINGSGKIVKLTHDPFFLSKRAHGRVTWKLIPDNPEFDFLVEFTTHGSPLDRQTFSKSHPTGNVVDKAVAVAYYPYNVTVSHISKNEVHDHSKDPGGIITA